MNKQKLNQPIDYLQELKRNVSIKEKLTLFQEICFEHIEKALNQSDPTIEEVKKEWEDDGYIWEEDDYRIYLKNSYNDTKIIIELFSKQYYIREYFSVDYQNVSIKEHIRLTKTFRALGWEV